MAFHLKFVLTPELYAGSPSEAVPSGDSRVQLSMPSRSQFDQWLEQALAAFRWLGASPWRLFATMFALNAVANPYSGLVHDSIVYSLQALNAATQGAYADDLFLKYGSQDRFSVFSMLVGPLVRAFGVRPVFFVLFVACTAFWLWAASRLVRELFADSAVAAASAVFVSVAPMWYGGIEVFHVAEPFFTPRLPACALAMLAVAAVLRNRPWTAWLLMLAAAAIHPIMAIPAFVICGGHVLVNRFQRWQAALVCVGLGLAAVLIVSSGSIAGYAFPRMDETWRAIVDWSPLNFPLEWAGADWLGIAGGLLIVSVAAWLLRHDRPAPAQVLMLVVAAAVVGLAVAVFASRSSNALLFQVQAYRALWLVAFVEGPAAVWLLLVIYRTRSRLAWLAGVALISYVGRRRPFDLQLAMIGATFLTLFVLRCARTNERARQIAIPTLAWAAVVASVAAAIMPPLVIAVVNSSLLSREDPAIVIEATLGTLAPLGWWILGAAAIVFVRHRLHLHRMIVATGILFAFVIHSVAYGAPLSEAYRARFEPERENMAFARHYLASRTAVRPLSVYADFAPALTIWLDWRATSYYQIVQSVGVIFSRANALEVQRRAALVRPFEAARWQGFSDRLPSASKVVIDRMYALHDGVVAPTPADLKRLCADAELDIAILSGRPLLAPSATNGHVSVYDCRVLRSGDGHVFFSTQDFHVE